MEKLSNNAYSILRSGILESCVGTLVLTMSGERIPACAWAISNLRHVSALCVILYRRCSCWAWFMVITIGLVKNFYLFLSPQTFLFLFLCCFAMVFLTFLFFLFLFCLCSLFFMSYLELWYFLSDCNLISIFLY